MSAYCGLLAERFGLAAASLELASVLHDVGKVAISDSILLKPGPLTPAERLQIEMHSEIGFGMLRDSSSGVLDLAAVIARTHHENFDGSGYPRGLAGDDIPLEGQDRRRRRRLRRPDLRPRLPARMVGGRDASRR